MAAKQKVIKLTFRVFTTALVVIAAISPAIFLSSFAALKSIAYAYSYKEISQEADLSDPATFLKVRRDIQHYFRAVDIHVDLDDIMGDNFRGVHRKLSFCERGAISVWLPLKFELPFFGSWVTEWCWKPTIAK